MRDEESEFRVSAVLESIREVVPDLRENAWATSAQNFGRSKNDRAEEHAGPVRLSEDTHELSESIRECELLCHALIAHSQISERIASCTMDEVEAVGRGSEVFPPWRPL